MIDKKDKINSKLFDMAFIRAPSPSISFREKA